MGVCAVYQFVCFGIVLAAKMKHVLDLVFPSPCCAAANEARACFAGFGFFFYAPLFTSSYLQAGCNRSAHGSPSSASTELCTDAAVCSREQTAARF